MQQPIIRSKFGFLQVMNVVKLLISFEPSPGDVDGNIISACAFGSDVGGCMYVRVCGVSGLLWLWMWRRESFVFFSWRKRSHGGRRFLITRWWIAAWASHSLLLSHSPVWARPLTLTNPNSLPRYVPFAEVWTNRRKLSAPGSTNVLFWLKLCTNCTNREIR